MTGGARSGKSRFAQDQAEALDGPLHFVATAQALDADMADRVARHRADRGPRWTTVEAPMDLETALAGLCPGSAVVVDCLTLWCANLLLAGHDEPSICTRGERLVEALQALARPAWVVTNEVGLGVVPDNVLARRYRDALGRLNQIVAGGSTTVTLLVAGLPLAVR